MENKELTKINERLKNKLDEEQMLEKKVNQNEQESTSLQSNLDSIKMENKELTKINERLKTKLEEGAI